MLYCLLDSFKIGATLINDNGVALFLQAEDRWAELDTDATSDAFGIDDVGHPDFFHALLFFVLAFGHKCALLNYAV